MNPSNISVVIPTLNEAEMVGGAIASALAAGAAEVIVADGGSDDATTRRATESGATKVVRSTPGRGTQQNAGARFATGEVILFLHADSRLESDCLNQICERSDEVWGAFRHRIADRRFAYRWIEYGNALRVRLRGIPFGDQAIFVRRRLFNGEGGFADLPLMEDVELSKRLRKIARPVLLPGQVSTSARRWQNHGIIRQTLLNWQMQFAFARGARAEDLARRYQHRD